MTVHKMRLAPRPFCAVRRGQKRVELRLLDEKRSLIHVDDEIVFENTQTGEALHCRVVALARFDSFHQLYNHYSKRDLGYADDEPADPDDMYCYYSPEQEKQYGVLAIEIVLL